MKRLFMNALSSNMLKTIALCAMVIDHSGFYFEPFLPNTIYAICRIVGRVAMPLFTYLLVQGFFHTKNYNKYLIRIIICAVVTQLVITICMLTNFRFVPEYTTIIYRTGNILFTFTLSLALMKLLHEPNLIRKWDYNKNMSLKVLGSIGIFAVAQFVPMDYGVEVVILTMLFYFVERLKLSVLIQRSGPVTNIKSILSKGMSEEKIHLIYLALILFSLTITAIYYTNNFYLLLAIMPIALYSGEKGNNSKFCKYSYYVIFPLHHAILYLGAMLFTAKLG